MSRSSTPPPPCHCIPSTPWGERRKDPPSIIGAPLDSRTCLQCGATLSLWLGADDES